MRSISTLAPGSTGRLYLPSLDGARGLAILMVVLEHFSSAKLLPYADFAGIGHIGVYLFFSLSAFLLTAPFCAKPPGTLLRREEWLTYFERRFLRIFPLYALALLVRCFYEPHFSWRNLGNELVLRHAEGVFWTIPVETRYYLVLPLIVLAVLVPWKRTPVAGVLGAVLLFVVLERGLFPAEKAWDLDKNYLRHFIMIFLLGSCAGAAHVYFISRPIRHPAARWLLEIVSVLCAIAIVCVVPGIDRALLHNAFVGLQDNILFFCFFWAVFLFCHLHGQGFVKALLEWRPLRYLGLISYSAYVWHKPVMTTLTWTPRLFWIKPLTVACATVAVASLSFFLFERPLSRVRARFTRSL